MRGPTPFNVPLFYVYFGLVIATGAVVIGALSESPWGPEPLPKTESEIVMPRVVVIPGIVVVPTPTPTTPKPDPAAGDKTPPAR